MIIVAVLLNTVVLSVLFVLAFNSEAPQIIAEPKVGAQIVVDDKLPPKLPTTHLLSTSEESIDEDKLELILNDLDLNENEPVARQQDWAIFTPHPSEQESKILQDVISDNIIEIIVKKGDSLDRIAKANATTVQSIRTLNGLKNDHLKIGQVLNVDVGSAKKIVDQRSNQPASIQNAKNQGSSTKVEPVYYTIKSGDSPWKVAKQFHVNMDDLLKLNQLDEEKARNLKIGDKIRVQ